MRRCVSGPPPLARLSARPSAGRYLAVSADRVIRSSRVSCSMALAVVETRSFAIEGAAQRASPAGRLSPTRTARPIHHRRPFLPETRTGTVEGNLPRVKLYENFEVVPSRVL